MLPRLINHDQPNSFRPLRGAFSFGETGCRNGEMNIAGVTIAGANIDLNVKLRATVVAIAAGQRHTVENGSGQVSGDGVGGA
jgi:hypothetical protein